MFIHFISLKSNKKNTSFHTGDDDDGDDIDISNKRVLKDLEGMKKYLWSN